VLYIQEEGETNVPSIPPLNINAATNKTILGKNILGVNTPLKVRIV